MNDARVVRLVHSAHMALHKAGPAHPPHHSARTRRSTDANPFVGSANPAVGLTVVPPHNRLEDRPVPPEVAYQLIHDDYHRDHRGRQGFVSRCSRWLRRSTDSEETDH